MHGFAHMLPHTLQPALAVAVATGAHPPFSASFYHFVLQHPELVLREEHRDVVCGTEGTIVSALLQKHVTTTAAQRRVCASFKPKLRKESTRSKRPLRSDEERMGSGGGAPPDCVGGGASEGDGAAVDSADALTDGGVASGAAPPATADAACCEAVWRVQCQSCRSSLVGDAVPECSVRFEVRARTCEG